MYISLNYKDVKAKEEYKKSIEENPRYSLDENILKKIITENKENHLNADLEYVYFISTLINSFYSTRMGNDRLHIVAKIISEKKGVTDKNVINIIEEINKKPFEYKKGNNDKNNKTFRAASFLSKYYAIHNRFLFHDGEYSDFAILDSAVEKCIKNIIDCAKENNPKYSQDFCKKLQKYKKKDIKNYEVLNKILKDIKDEINRAKDEDYEITLTDIDNYFWGISKNNNSSSTQN